MILKTELKKTTVHHEDVVLHVQQLTTTALTEIALGAQDGGTAASMKETFVRAVFDWTGVTDEAGGKVDCTPENRALVYDANPNFIEVVLTKINEELDLAIEAEKKI